MGPTGRMKATLFEGTISSEDNSSLLKAKRAVRFNEEGIGTPVPVFDKRKRLMNRLDCKVRGMLQVAPACRLAVVHVG